MESMVVFYPCLNIDETAAFYQEHLGLKLYDDQGKCKIFDTGYGYLGFCEYDDHELATKTCISFSLKDEAEVDAYYARCVAHHEKILSKPARHPQFHVYSFFIEDVNGYKVEFQKIEGK